MNCEYSRFRRPPSSVEEHRRVGEDTHCAPSVFVQSCVDAALSVVNLVVTNKKGTLDQRDALIPGGGGEDRTPDLGVMNPEMKNLGSVVAVDDR